MIAMSPTRKEEDEGQISQRILCISDVTGETLNNTHAHCHSDKNIQNHFYIPSEDEILFLPTTQFKIIECCHSTISSLATSSSIEFKQCIT